MLPIDTLARVDQIRGLVPRSAYIRELIDMALMMRGGSALPTSGLPELFGPEGRTAPVPDAHKSGGMKTEKPHRHRMVKGEEAGYQQGKKVYLYTCECGETEVR